MLQHKVYTAHYENLTERIKCLIEERERWQSVAEKSTPCISEMPKGGGGNLREDAICEMVDCDRQIDYYVDKLCELRRQVSDYIARTGDRDERLLKIIEVK